jgi:hypothetical protein
VLTDILHQLILLQGEVRVGKFLIAHTAIDLILDLIEALFLVTCPKLATVVLAKRIERSAARHHRWNYLGRCVLTSWLVGINLRIFQILRSSANKLRSAHRSSYRVSRSLRVCLKCRLVLGHHKGPWLHWSVRVKGDAFVECVCRGRMGCELHLGTLCAHS